MDPPSEFRHAAILRESSAKKKSLVGFVVEELINPEVVSNMVANVERSDISVIDVFVWKVGNTIGSVLPTRLIGVSKLSAWQLAQ